MLNLAYLTVVVLLLIPIATSDVRAHPHPRRTTSDRVTAGLFGLAGAITWPVWMPLWLLGRLAELIDDRR